MATTDIIGTQKDALLYASILDSDKGEAAKSVGSLIEKKIDFLENMTTRVSNRRTRRWLNDRILMELVPRLNAEEIRGLFSPPPFGNDVRVSPFIMTQVGEWDKLNNIDMDKEASVEDELNIRSSKRKANVSGDKKEVLNAWHRIDSRTREALRRSFLSDLIEGYEKSIRTFIEEGADAEVLMIHVQDPFHRLLLHGVCEFYNLTSTTETRSEGSETVKTTRIKKRKKSGSTEVPKITLIHFLRMSKEGLDIVTSAALENSPKMNLFTRLFGFWFPNGNQPKLLLSFSFPEVPQPSCNRGNISLLNERLQMLPHIEPGFSGDELRLFSETLRCRIRRILDCQRPLTFLDHLLVIIPVLRSVVEPIGVEISELHRLRRVRTGFASGFDAALDVPLLGVLIVRDPGEADADCGLATVEDRALFVAVTRLVDQRQCFGVVSVAESS
ncbi:hypothetical protein V2J09_016169 [Rumex salicifolius]